VLYSCRNAWANLTHFSLKACWPVWGDNHYCYDSWTGDISDIAKKYEANKGKPSLSLRAEARRAPRPANWNSQG
jgi:hypothetical protein